jgi:hypothetical protein
MRENAIYTRLSKVYKGKCRQGGSQENRIEGEVVPVVQNSAPRKKLEKMRCLSAGQVFGDYWKRFPKFHAASKR